MTARAPAQDRREELAGWADSQAMSCRLLGSPLWAGVLSLVAADWRSGGPLWSLLGDVSDRRFGDALPLRVLGAAHHLALSGGAPELAALVPSCGGWTDPDDSGALGRLTTALTSALSDHPAILADYLGRSVQTNEVGRAGGLVLGLAATTGDIRLIEIGPSAGLNLRLDRFSYEANGRHLAGDPDSGVVIDGVWDPPWRGAALPRVTSRVGVDPHPMDVADPHVADRLYSYVWPDQPDRLRRLRAAIDLARSVPATLTASLDTAGWLAATLGGSPPRPTLVFHSIVCQYIDKEDRPRIVAALEAAGDSATDQAPLWWMRYEPDPADRSRAEIRLRSWPGGRDAVIAHACYHGRWIRPLPHR